MLDCESLGGITWFVNTDLSHSESRVIFSLLVSWPEEQGDLL